MFATEKDTKDEQLQCAIFLSLVGESVIGLLSTFIFEDHEHGYIALLIQMFDVYCMPKKTMKCTNVSCSILVVKKTHPTTQDETFYQFLTNLRQLSEDGDYGELRTIIILF